MLALPYRYRKFSGASGYGFADAARQRVSVNLVAHGGWVHTSPPFIRMTRNEPKDLSATLLWRLLLGVQN